MFPSPPRVAVVGATGAVGQTFLSLFEERSFPLSELHLVASSRSAGRTVHALGTEYTVQDIEHFDFGRVDIAFFSAGGSVSRQWAPKAVAAGALVIDNTNTFRMDPDTPLVVPQVNARTLIQGTTSGIIANPNCSTIPLVRLLDPIHRRWSVESVVVSTYQAASGRGVSGVEELRRTSGELAASPHGEPEVTAFPEGLAFNAIPNIDTLLESGSTLEERKMLQESRKILGEPDLHVTATCVRVPVVNGHSEAVHVRLGREADRASLVRLLSEQPEVRVHDLAEPGAFPTPRSAAAEPDHVHVGRVRVVEGDPRSVWLWLVSDNLRVGAALNAVQIAEYLAEEAS
ncbi:aspartate-semialdehyde dehydrogenase [Nocardiopsis valliformis]|uniref:aspartate-semialdehyde dehydrogenase n=1 Tax=Nocardiopsis valliformis TaxID=239974 RepID=UPI000347FDEB|nr:aspartate-semialdehyde dehydrogenase [Nocardiopsis valliformis]